MKVAYFDCFSGISGDMTLGALISCGLNWQQLQTTIAKLPIEGYSLSHEIIIEKGIEAIKVSVNINKEAQNHQPARHLKEIAEIIKTAALPEEVEKASLEVFAYLAWAEARVHHTSMEEIHFHEVGAIDSIIDIVGSIWGLYQLGIEQIYASPLPQGTGMIQCQHGRIPNPAPATLELLRGVPVYGTNIEYELVTPTGAALLTGLGAKFGSMPILKTLNIGYGAGTHKLEQPNLLRLIIGEKNSI